MVRVLDEDKALFGTWTNESETVELVVDGTQPYMIILVNGEQTFEASGDRGGIVTLGEAEL